MQSWRVNPGQCKLRDDDQNGWCDDLDEVFGCMDRRACNSGTSIVRGEAKRARGEECNSDAQCLSLSCSLCDGTFRCTDYNNRNSCEPRIRNLEHITRNIEAFCRFPYSKEFKCKKNDILFSSLQGIEIKDSNIQSYVESSREVRQQMIRCIDVPEFHSMCNSIQLDKCNIRQDSDLYDIIYPSEVCCKCGGGRVY